MLGTTSYYLSYAMTQNSNISLQITVDQSATCMIHAQRRPRDNRLLKGEYKCLNALPAKILQINGAVTRRRRKLRFCHFQDRRSSKVIHNFRSYISENTYRAYYKTNRLILQNNRSSCGFQMNRINSICGKTQSFLSLGQVEHSTSMPNHQEQK